MTVDESDPMPNGDTHRQGNRGRMEKGASLTPKELEIVRLLVGGSTVNEIAARTGRHRSTVYEHIERIRDRLGVRTQAEIAAYAVRHRLF